MLKYVCSQLSEICRKIRSIQMGIHTDSGKQTSYQMPRALPGAFQHIVMTFVVIGNTAEWSSSSWNRMRGEFDDCKRLLVEGQRQLMQMIHTADYRESAGSQAVDSVDLLSLILANLVHNLSTDTDYRLTEIYSEYTTRLQLIVRDQASVRVYDNIKLLREEIDTIKFTLKQQHKTLLEFRRSRVFPFNLSLSVIDRMLDSIEQRMDDFDEL